MGGEGDLTDTVVRELSLGTHTWRERNACHNIKLEIKIFTVKPLLSPFEEGLTEMGGLFNLEITMVSVLHKELEYKDIVEKLKYKKV